jgi:DNA-binding response OmpR family regulator
MNDEAATVLVVEDDDATRTFLADNLTADGHDVLVADCARDALRLLESKFPDVVVLETALPDSSGLDLMRRVRAADGLASRVNPATPLLVLSHRHGELDRVRAFEAGADDHVGKPFSYSELRACASRRCCAGSTPAAAAARGSAWATWRSTGRRAASCCAAAA